MIAYSSTKLPNAHNSATSIFPDTKIRRSARQRSSHKKILFKFLCKKLCIVGTLFFIQYLHNDASAQTASPTPYSPVSGTSIDSVNLTTGALQVAIPLWSIKQRGNLSLSFSLRYQSGGVVLHKECQDYDSDDNKCVGPTTYPVAGPYGSFIGTEGQYGTAQYSGTPFQIVDNISIQVTKILDYNPNTQTPGEPPTLGYYWQLTTPDGSTHKLANIGSSNFRATDGTGWLWNESSGIAISEDGVRYVMRGAGGNTVILQYVEDANGNQISINSSNGIPVSYTDTLGRVIPYPSLGGGIDWTDNTANCTGQNPASHSAVWNVPGYQGTVAFTFCYGNTPTFTNFSPQSPSVTAQNLQGTVFSIQSVILPDGTAWTFSFQNPNSSNINYGDLTQITTPTGGTITYAWVPSHNTPALCSLGTFPYYYTSQIQSRTLSSGQPGSAGMWMYNIGPETVTSNSRTITTTVTDPTGAYIVHTISGIADSCSYFDTQDQAYNVNGDLLKTETHTYTYQPDIDVVATNGSYSNSGITGSSTLYATYLSGPDPYVMNVLPIVDTVTWPNGSTAQTTYQYSNTFTATDVRGMNTYQVPYGMPSTVTKYDYGNGSPGPALSQRATTYYAFSNSNALTNNLLILPSSIVDTDPTQNSSNTITTTYGYDETGLQNGNTSGAGWNSSPLAGTTRGNQTSVNRYWDTNSQYITSAKTYNNNGTVASSTEPTNSAISGSLTTAYQYSSTYDGAWLTGVTDPQGKTSTLTYDSSSGFLTGTTDQNQVSSTYTYYPNLKLQNVQRQGGDHNLASSISYTYPSQNVVQKVSLLSGNSNETDVITYDGLGRVIQTQHADPQGNEYIDTVYDPNGRIYSKSTPYRTKSGTQFYGLTTYSYDGLNRLLTTTNPDQTYVKYTYNGSTTLSTNESNGTTSSQHLSRVDGLGRLVAECEMVTSATPTQMGGDSPSSCGLEISGTGFLTTYTQTMRGMTASTQGAQTRTFAYDSLNRLTDSTNPESGHLHFVYDPDGNVISKVAPAPNASQSSGSTVTTTLTYDNLHHLLAKSYAGTNAASTPSVTYNYSETTVDGNSLEYTIGRLSSEYTTLGSTIQTKSIYSYDTDGRISSHYQCVLANCTSSYQDVEYHYDGIGNVVSQTTPQAGFSNTYDSAGHLTSMLPAWNVDANHPATLISPVYAPNGAWATASLGNGLSEVYSYQPRWLSGMQVTNNAQSVLYGYGISRAGDAQIVQSSDSVNGTWNYTYDDFNRLLTAQEVNSSNTVTNGLSWQYDRYGNRWNQNVTAGSGRGSSDQQNTSTNQSSLYLRYDAAGNVLSDQLNSYTYDAENRIATVSGGMSYVYDAEGRRVGKNSTSSVVVNPATGSSGSINISGTEQAISTQATSGSGTITVTGTDGSNTVCTTTYVYVPSEHRTVPEQSCKTVPDTGTLSVTIDGFTSSANYASGTSDSTIAQTIANGFSTSGSPVTVIMPSATSVTLTAVATGTSSNYPITFSNGGGYTISDPNMTLIGGQNAGSGYDTRSVIVTIVNNSVSPAQSYTSSPVTWGQASNDGTLANALANAINSAAGGIVQATPGSSSVGITSNATGSRTNYTLSVSVTDTSTTTTSPSFIFQPSGMSGGTDPVYGSSTASATVYVVSPTGTVIDELNNGNWVRTEIYAAGHHVATSNASSVAFVHEDWLGTERARSNMAGQLCQTTSSQPFGDNASISTPAGVNSCNFSSNFFTGKQRDSESQLDDFGARYFSSQWGHWMSPDWSSTPTGVPYAAYNNPQSLNLYAYLGNDPIGGADPDGHRGEFRFPATFALSGLSDNESAELAEFDLMVASAGTVNPSVSTTETVNNQTPSNNQNTPASSILTQQRMALSVLAFLQMEVDTETDAEPNVESPEIEPSEPNSFYTRMGNVYNMMRPGPLPDDIAATFSGGEYAETTVGGSGWGIDNARVYGGRANALGRNGTFFSTEPQVGGLQSMIDYGLRPEYGNTAENTVCAYIPPGTVVFVGQAANQGGAWVAGKIQIYVPPVP